MKEIIFFAHDLSIGGMEKSLLALLNELVKDYKVTLILENKSGVLLPELSKKVILEEFKLSSCKVSVIRKAINFSNRLLWYIKRHNKYDFSCNYATYSRLCSKLALISSRNNSIYVHSNYCGMYNDENKIKDFYNYICLFDFKKIIFVSNEAMNSSIKLFKSISEKSCVINNLLTIRDNNETIKYDKKDKHLLFLGRLDDSSKNLNILIDSFKYIKRDKLNIKLWIVGDGPDKKKYMAKVDKDKLVDYITFYESTPEPYKYLRACDGIILTSKYEGFPVVYMEALYFGKSIITTIPTSEKYLDIRDYASVCDKTAESIYEEIKKDNFRNSNKKVNFNNINKNKINDIKALIEQ